MGSVQGGRLVFVHGIGGVRDASAQRDEWLAALAEGARRDGRTAAARSLEQDGPAMARFVNYSDIFVSPDSQGTDESAFDENEDGGLVAVLDELVAALVEQLAEQLGDSSDPREARVLADALAQLSASPQDAQGTARVLVSVLSTVLELPGLRQGAQWVSGKQFLFQLSQVGRYLRRSEPDAAGLTLDQRVRARMSAALAADDGTGRPTVVLGHSLGSVVAFEALHERTEPIQLLVTVGSPIAMGAVVYPRLLPRPLPRTPECVRRWLNFWDRDDIVAARPKIENRIKANSEGISAETQPVKSTGLWTHTATKYLKQPTVAGPIVEALESRP